MSGGAKREQQAEEREAQAPAGAEGGAGDALPPVDEIGDDEAERMAAEAETWLAEQEGKEAKAADAPEASDEQEPPLDEVEVRELLRRALRPPPGSVAPSLLGGVQKKLRARSKGKFYGDGWSTARSPRSTYLITSLLMLVLMVFVFLILVPWGGGALP
jgi:hypothetical protein